VKRGDAIGLHGQWGHVRTMEAWVRTSPGQAIPRRGDWHLYCGSGGWPVDLYPVSGWPVPADSASFLRIETKSALPLAPGDQFVLRESGRGQTIGGGVVLDIAPGERAHGTVGRAARAARLSRRFDALRVDDRASLVVDHVQAHGFIDLGDAIAIGALSVDMASVITGDPRLLSLGRAIVDADQACKWREAAVAAVRRGHAERPLQRAVARDVAARAAMAAGCPAALASLLLVNAVERRELAAEGAGVRLPSHSVQLNRQQSKAADELIELLNGASFAPPDLRAAANAAGAEEIIDELEASGRLLRIGPDLAITPEMLERGHDLLRGAFLRDGPLTASQARDVLDTTRKYVLPLLAHMDRRGLTRRVGDLRIVHDTPQPQNGISR